MSEPLDLQRLAALTSEGARMRMLGRPKDACPYPLDSPEREAWMEGFDGEPADQAPDLPSDRS